MEAGDQVEEEPEDDYTPLDPAYLPPGLEEEDASDKDVSKDVSVNLDEVSQHSTVLLLLYNFLCLGCLECVSPSAKVL